METSDKLTSYLLLTLFLIFTACGGGGSSQSSPWEGRWLLLSTNGEDRSALNLIYTFTETTLHVDAEVYNCTSDNDFWSDGTNFRSKITGGDCPGTVLGKTSSGNISFDGNKMTIHQTEYGGAPIDVVDVFSQL